MKKSRMPGFTAAASLAEPSEEYLLGAGPAHGKGEHAVVPQFCTPCVLGKRLCCGLFSGCHLEDC